MLRANPSKSHFLSLILSELQYPVSIKGSKAIMAYSLSIPFLISFKVQSHTNFNGCVGKASQWRLFGGANKTTEVRYKEDTGYNNGGR